MKKIILVILAALLVLGGVLLLKKRQQAVEQGQLPQPMSYTVKIVTPKHRTVLQSRSFLAKLESRRSAKISSRLTGRITRIEVKEGQRVNPGQVLARIDQREVRANLEALQANLAPARRDLAYKRSLHARNRDLFKAGGLSREKLEASGVALAAAAGAVKNLEQKIKALESQLDYLSLTAPFAAVVGTVFMRRGDLATPGRPILSLNSLERKLTFSFVAGREQIARGQVVLHEGREIGRVATIYDDAQAGLPVAEVALEEKLAGPNQSYLGIEVITGRATGCSVPLQALIHTSAGERLMLYRDGRFRPLAVAVKARGKEYAVVAPCPQAPVAVASEAKLSLLPTYGAVRVIPGDKDAK